MISNIGKYNDMDSFKSNIFFDDKSAYIQIQAKHGSEKDSNINQAKINERYTYKELYIYIQKRNYFKNQNSIRINNNC